MTVFLASLGLYLTAFVVHVLLWRIHVPRRQTKTLLILQFLILGAGLVFFRYRYDFLDLVTAIRISLFYVSFTLAYMITFTVIEADSPSLVMIMRIYRAGRRGMKKSDFYAEMNDETLLVPRINDLLRDKLAVEENGRLVVTKKGRMMTGLILAYRSLLRTGKGG